MTFEEVLKFFKDHNVEIYTRFERITGSVLVRMRRGNYAIDQSIPAEYVHEEAFGLTIRLILRQMAAALDDMEEKK